MDSNISEESLYLSKPTFLIFVLFFIFTDAIRNYTDLLDDPTGN